MTEPEHIGIVLDGRYRVTARLGQGGMGTVYAAEHVGLGQRRAIKFLRVDIARKPGAIKRFLQEARVLSSMHHDNLVGVVDMGEYVGSAYYVMEFLEGEDLRGRLRRLGPLNWPQTRAVALQMCQALRLTHARGIVHRDLKPENCFVTRTSDDGELRIKLIDFGVAKVPREMGGTSQLTGTGETLGTVGYMAPEQLEGRGDWRVDVYSLGTMIYEMLVGRAPYSGNAFEIIARMLRSDVPPLSEVCEGVDPAIEAIVRRATHREPDERFESMDAFSAAILAVPETAAPQHTNDRRSTEPERPRVRSLVDGEATTMPGGDDSVRADTEAAPDGPVAPALMSVSASAATLGRPRRRSMLPLVGAVLVGATAPAVWLLLAGGDATEQAEPLPVAPDPPAQLEPPTTAPRAAASAPASGPAEAVVPEPGGEPSVVRVDPGPIAAPAPSVEPAAARPAAKAAPAVPRPLARDAFKRRLERELLRCRPKFADEDITIRVTPGKSGKLEQLAPINADELAPRTVRCLEEELARVRDGLKEGVDARKVFDVNLTLAKAP